ncbi:MAG: class I SAM-dependent methyltransferase [Planctomycetes bacterium]|nr:class I SAM-dependent methyltransferase [Planctomycetota bacterium]
MKVDYNKIYSSYSQEHINYIKNMAIWKAKYLCKLIKDEPAESILEIGTGRGDVLNACYPFKVKIGADISDEAIKQHHDIYKEHKLVKIDADKPLPFKDNEVDFVLLCDILEHIDNPAFLLREAGRVGRNVLLKIPIENALLLKFMMKINKVEYGPNHPSGHLYCWTMSDVKKLVEKSGLKIVRSKFLPTPANLLKKKYLLKTITVSLISLADLLTADNFFSKILIGGSSFAIAHK